MAARSPAEDKRIRYLLDLCSQAEREHIEASYFEDDDAFQEMLTAEDDLVDAYARGALTAEERRRFEKHFLTSSRGTDRVQFAGAFAAVSDAPSVQTKPHVTALDLLATVRGWRRPLRIVTVTAVILLVALLSWLLIERRRTNQELRELHAKHAAVSKQAEALRPSADAEQTPTTETTLQPENVSASSVKWSQRKRGTKIPRQARPLPAADLEITPHRIAGSEPGHEKERPLFTNVPRVDKKDAAIRKSPGFHSTRQIAVLPLNPVNVANLLSLSMGTTVSLMPRHTNSSSGIIITLPLYHEWITFQLGLDTVAQHREYRVAIETAEGHPVKSVYWMEPAMPARNSIDTPKIATFYLISGDYVLLLTGKEPDGAFVRVAEYSFTIVRD